MARSLRILHTADSHIGAALPARPRTGGRRRGDDLVESFRRVLDRAADHDVDLVIHAGDLFNRSKPSSRALAAAAEPLLKLAVAGIPVVIVPGNHERSVIPACLFLSHPNIHIVSKPCTLTFHLRGTRVAIAALPCLRRGAAEDFDAALQATRWSEARADVKILAVHQTFESATCGPGSYRFRTGDDVVERVAVPAEFDLVAAGHVHRHQTLSTPDANGLSIVYAGSPDRISFAELAEPKGYVMIEEAEGRLVHRFVEHEVRPMSVWPMDVSGLTRSQIREQVETILGGLQPSAIAQLRLSGRSTPDAMRGLKFADMARETRRDVLFTVCSRSVEFVPDRTVQRQSRRAKCTFANLFSPSAETIRVSRDDLGRLPNNRGVYAMHDATGRLLYVGKSKNVRARVRAHLRARSGANYFRGWGLQVVHVEARVADSELEALLVEAELIRMLRPPFNRQMRRWRRYCYLCEGNQPYRQLEVCPQPKAGRRCYGPFRSRQSAESVREAVAAYFGLALCPDDHAMASGPSLLGDGGPANLCERYYQGLCGGPCAGRVTGSEYDSRIALRHALLAGTDAALPVAAGPGAGRRCTNMHGSSTSATGSGRHSISEIAEALDRGGRRQTFDANGAVTERVKTLQDAFRHASTLHEAEHRMDGLLLMPGSNGCRKTACMTPRGIRFDVMHNDPDDAKRILAQHRTLVARSAEWHGRAKRRPAVVKAGCHGQAERRHAVTKTCRRPDVRRGVWNAPATRELNGDVALVDRSNGDYTARLPKTVVDGFCVAVRELRRNPGRYRFISKRQLPQTDALSLLAQAFDQDRHDDNA